MTAGSEGDPAAGPDPEDIKVLARGGAATLVGSVAQALSGMLLLVGLGRVIGTDGAGAFLEAVAIFNIAAVTATLGVDTGFIRSLSRSRVLGRGQDIRRILWVGYVPLIVLGLIAALLVALNAEMLASFLAEDAEAEQVAQFVRVFAVFIPFGAMLLATLGATRAYETMVPTVAVDRIGRLGAQAVLVVVALLLGLDDLWVAVAWGLPVLAAMVWSASWLRRLTGSEKGDTGVAPTPLRSVVSDFWSFTLPRTFASIFRVAVLWLDVLLVGALISASAAGIYAVSTRLLQLGLAVAFAVGQASQPMISRLITDSGSEATRRLYETATAWQVLLTWPQYLILAVFASAFLGIFGSGFIDGAAVVVILAVSAMIGGGAGPVDMVLLMAGKSLWSFWNTALSLSINVVLNLWLIPQIGITGAAFAWATSRVVGNVLPLLQLRSTFRLHPFGARWARAALLSLAIFGGGGVAVRLVVGDGLLTAIVFGLLASVGYGLILYRWRDRLDLSTAVAGFRRRLGRRSPA